MTTAGLKNDQLPNNRLEVFKSNTQLVKASEEKTRFLKAKIKRSKH
jgi:hypothetical protein